MSNQQQQPTNSSEPSAMAVALSGITRRISTAWKNAKAFARTLRKGRATGRDSTTDPNERLDQRQSMVTTLSLEESKLFRSMELSYGYDAASAVNYPAGMTRRESMLHSQVPPPIVPRVPSTMPTVLEKVVEDSPLVDYGQTSCYMERSTRRRI